MKPKSVVAMLLSALFAGSVLAQSAHAPRIDPAQQAIVARIQAGLASGHLTPSEAQMLIRRDRDLQLRENQLKANGSITPPERQQLRAELSALGADVERLMLNGEVMRPLDNAGNASGIDNRDHPISQRIHEGLRSGRITQREARRLQSREREISRHEAFFKSDGVVTKHEQRQLRDELDELRNEVERRISQDRNNPG